MSSAEDRIPNPFQSDNDLSNVRSGENNPVHLALLKRFPGARILTAEDIAADEALIAEARRNALPPNYGFRKVGAPLAGAGWHVIPQSKTGRRLGSIIRARALEWKPFQDVAPPLNYVATWANLVPMDNTALICGNGATAASRVRVIDIDVSNAFWAEQLRNLAILHLGYTPVQRQGRAPRWALFYREDVETPVDQTIRSRSFTFEEQSEEAVAFGSHDGLEILSAGRMITVAGTHHKTGAPFVYADKTLAQVSPEDLPVIDPDKISAYLRAVHELLRIKNFERRVVDTLEREAVEYDPALRVVVPPYKTRRGVWEKVEGGNSRIVDDRKGWALDRTLAWVCYNAEHVRAGGAGLAQIRERCLAEAVRHIERTGDWSTEAAITRHVVELFDRTARRFCDGEFPERTVHITDDGKAYTKPEAMLAIQSSLGRDGEYIRPVEKRRKSPSAILSSTAANESVAAERALLDTEKRIALGVDVSRRVRAAIRAFLMPIWDARDAKASKEEIRAEVEKALAAIHLLKAPTGAGKTSTLIREVREIVRERGRLGLALLIAMPSHANANEGMGVAMEKASEEELAAAWNEALKAASGLHSMVWKGKILAGCHFGDQVATLYQAGIPASGMCGTKVPQIGGEMEFVPCPMASQCGAMKQLELASQADVIFVPHAYLTTPLPKALKEAAAAIIIDEAFWNNLIRTQVLPVDILRRARKAPKPSKAEAKAGITADDLIRGRDQAAEVVIQALYTGSDPAEALWRWSAPGKNGVPYNGTALVQDAITVCTRANHIGLGVRPGMTMSMVEQLVSEPRGEHLNLEKRFWQVVAERIKWLTADHAEREACKLAGREFDERNRRAKHDRDTAIQLLRESDAVPGKADGIRVSWIREMNFSDLPMMLLDASADEKILSMVLPGREFTTTIIDEPLHLRTVVIPDSFSDLSLLAGGRHLDEASRHRAADRLAKVQRLISYLAAMYGWSRILVAATKAVRREMTMYWPGPINADFGHYGALKGLDFAKRHMAAVCVGRMEPPVSVLDGYVGAVARLCADYEPAWDEEGTGWCGNRRLEAPKGEKTLAMRHGGSITIKAAEYGEMYYWHRRFQRQFREEEIRQAIGRLRPVYRAEPLAPIAFILSSAVPEGLIVDDVVNLDDVGGVPANATGAGAELLEIVHRLGGVLDPIAGPAVGADLRDLNDEFAMLTAVRELSARERCVMSVARVWEDGRPDPRTVYMMPWVQDHEWALTNASTLAGRCLDAYVVDEMRTIDPDAAEKGPDKLDREMSSLGPKATMHELREERRARECEWREYGIARWGKGNQKPTPSSPKFLHLATLIILEQAGVIPPLPSPEPTVPIPEPIAA